MSKEFENVYAVEDKIVEIFVENNDWVRPVVQEFKGDKYVKLDCFVSKMNEKDQRIAELEEQLKNAIVLPKELQVGNKVFWANEDGLFIGEIKTISKDTTVWFYVVYDNGLTYWHLLEDFNNEVFSTKEEAQAKLEELVLLEL